VSSGRALAVGCSLGADALGAASAWASRSALPAVSVFAAFGPSGVGRGAWSSPLASVSRWGACVSWWAGGGPGLPLAARLASRTAAAVAFVASAGPGSGVVLFAPSLSGGSLLAARAALGASLPLVVFGPCPAPLLGGSWARAGAGVWAAAWRWVPPPSLF
jgi:hypothetical protein